MKFLTRAWIQTQLSSFAERISNVFARKTDAEAHCTQKATQSILGHVKLSNSAAITTPGEYALDAVEKNASVQGTLANLIQQTNSNLRAVGIGYELKNGWRWSSGTGITRIGNVVNICLGIIREQTTLREGDEIIQIALEYIPGCWTDIPVLSYNVDGTTQGVILYFNAENGSIVVGNIQFEAYYLLINASWIAQMQ